MTDADLLKEMFAAGVAAVEPHRALLPHLKDVEGVVRDEGLKRIVVAGFGKGALPMALAAEEVLGDAVAKGLVVVPHGADFSRLPRRIEVAAAGHPDPDRAGLRVGRRSIELARQADAATLLLLLVSGGGSALCTAPAAGITLEEKQATARLLMHAGADIEELNTVRKHLSAVKGGRLAVLAHPARVVVLAISDVPGDRPDVIASGPASPDPTTYAQALEILERRGVRERVPAAVLRLLLRGEKGAVAETPKPGDPAFAKVETIIAARNRDAVEGAARAAAGLGLKVAVREFPILGEARRAGAELAKESLKARDALGAGERLCLVGGGETTVTVRGRGRGGRNQELALSFALAAEGEAGVALLSAGTDGIDGPTDAAGAIVDGLTVPRARREGMDPAAFLADNDSYHLLERVGALLKTGPTGTNVMDLQLALVTGPPR